MTTRTHALSALARPGYRSIYVRWIGANALAEFVGLGSSLALGAGLFVASDSAPLGLAIVYALAIAALSALIEGTLVGGLQWRVLRGPLPALDARRYIAATVFGAFVAWVLGMLPSTIISALAAPTAATDASAATFEPSLALQMLLAVGMGIVLGPFLGVPQWRVLRTHLPRAGWWIPANMSAWALGMPMVFLGTSMITPDSSTLQIAFAVLAGVLAAGIVVGAVHGLWLVWLLAVRDDARTAQPGEELS